VDLPSLTLLIVYATVRCHTSDDNIKVISVKRHVSLSVHVLTRFQTPVLLLMTESTSICDCEFV